MGQKVRPTSLRLGINEDWRSRWFASKMQFSKFLVGDQKIRRFIKENYKYAAISKIEIERMGDKVVVTLHTARPGIVIGRRGAEVEKLRDRIEEVIGKSAEVNIKEITKPELDAQLVAELICEQLEKRTNFRRAAKKAITSTMGAGAGGIKARISGRLSGKRENTDVPKTSCLCCCRFSYRVGLCQLSPQRRSIRVS